MLQYYILTLSPRAGEVFAWIHDNSITCEVHLNRTRFWLDPDTKLYTEFAIRFADSCPRVLESPDDYGLGHYP
jgi:hypothetical protein